MAGRKNFVSGSILTASDVNSFLMDQSVMVFDDSAARGSAIPTPSEGMVTYLKSDDQVTVFDGAAFKPVGGLVAVKSALNTNAFSASVSEGGNVAVTGLSITHEVQDPANRLIITAFFGLAANSNQANSVGIAVNDGSGLIGVGTGVGSRTATTTGAQITGTVTTALPHAMSIVHTPGAGSKTYTVRAVSNGTGTRTVFINRFESDTDASTRYRGASGLIIQEVAV